MVVMALVPSLFRYLYNNRKTPLLCLLVHLRYLELVCLLILQAGTYTHLKPKDFCPVDLVLYLIFSIVLFRTSLLKSSPVPSF